MLHNPKWDESKSNLLLNDQIEWLRKQPADGTYEWGDGELCLMAQYFRAVGQPHPSMPDWYMDVSLPRPWTFGAALKRAEAVRLRLLPTGE